jgi:hypothetical protein
MIDNIERRKKRIVHVCSHQGDYNNKRDHKTIFTGIQIRQQYTFSEGILQFNFENKSE